MPSDEQLMARYANGDTGAFDALYRRYERRSFAFFLRRTGSPDRACDLFQEQFLRLHRWRHAFQADRRFEPWFFRIARSVLADEWRRRALLAQPLVKAFDPVAVGDPEREAGAREALVHALGSLSGDERAIVCAAMGEGVGYREIAAASERSVAAVKQIASRATRRLRGEKRRRWLPVCLVFVLMTTPLLSLVASAQAGDDPALEQVLAGSADRPVEHRALAEHYRARAAAAKQSADSHRWMAEHYSGSLKPAIAAQQKKHCARLAGAYDLQAKTFEQLARAHEEAASPP